VNVSFDLVIVKHNPITIDGDIVGGCGVNPPNLASVSAYDDVGGAIDAVDEVLKVSHSCLP
jgi:hypothetical protein